jgi:hypothetical protein
MKTDEDLSDSGLTILDQQPDAQTAYGLTLGDAPPEEALQPESGEEELLRAERLLVGNGKDENYYSFYGLENFQEVSVSDLARVTELKDRMVGLAEREWGGNERTEARFNELNRALNKAFTRLTQQKASFDKDLRKILLDKLGTIVDQYLKTNTIGTASIEIDEYRAIMEEYESKRVISADRQDELKAFHENLAQLVADRRGDIVGLETQFADSLKDLTNRDFIDIPENRTKIADRYRELKEAECYIQRLEKRSFSTAEVMPEVEAALGRAGLPFRRKEEVFEAEVFLPFAARLGVEKGGQINSFNYGQLLVKARDEYFFSEAEVQAFCDARGVKVKAEVELKFNFGFTADRSRKLEAQSYEEIVSLFEEFPDKAMMKLYDGDLEVYLDNLGNDELREKIKDICNEYSGEEDHPAGLKKTIYTLLPARPYVSPRGVECRGIEELGDAIENELDVFRDKLLFQRNNDVLLFLEARDAREVAHEVRAWIASGKSQDKRLNGIVWVLQGKVFKREGTRFTSPDQVVRLGDENIKARLASELADEDSKFGVWIEECHATLVKNLEKWRKLKRYNAVTISYALEAKHPFHNGDDRVYSLSEFAESILKAHVKDKAFLDAFLDEKSSLRTEAEFWLKEYQSTDAIAAMRSYLGLVAQESSFKDANDRVIGALSSTYSKGRARKCWEELLPLAENLLAQGTISPKAYAAFRSMLVALVAKDANDDTDKLVHSYLERKIGDSQADKQLVLELFKYFQRPSMDRDFYVKKIQPLLDEAVKKGVVAAEVLEWQRKYFLEKYEQDIVKEGYDGKVAIIDAMRTLDPHHPLVELHRKSDESMKNCVRKANAACRMKNALKRDILATLSLLATLGISFLPSLYKTLSWSPLRLNTHTAGLAAFWILIVGIPLTIIIVKKARS